MEYRRDTNKSNGRNIYLLPRFYFTAACLEIKVA